jgi:hypothetical protein
VIIAEYKPRVTTNHAYSPCEAERKRSVRPPMFGTSTRSSLATAKSQPSAWCRMDVRVRGFDDAGAFCTSHADRSSSHHAVVPVPGTWDTHVSSLTSNIDVVFPNVRPCDSWKHCHMSNVSRSINRNAWPGCFACPRRHVMLVAHCIGLVTLCAQTI